MEATGAKFKVDVSPRVLVWARESIGLPIESAAKKLKIKPETLVRMEEGRVPVTIGKLREMTKAYDRPLIAFFLPEPPAEAERLPDFRVIHESENRSWSPALHRAYRRAFGQRQVALELALGEDEPLPEVDVRLDMTMGIEEAGGIMRDWLEPAQQGRGDPYAVLSHWVRRIEDKGILVVQISDVAIEEMRGFSIGEHPLPVIALNGSEFPRGKLFTLLHELIHILLRRSALCDLEDAEASDDRERQQLEWFCNGAAAATLMPRSVIVSYVDANGGDLHRQWSDQDLSNLATQFGVSLEAMLVRLVTLGLASREYYRERRPAFLELYREQRRTSVGFLTYYPKQIRNMGRRYIATVWRAYERGDISDTELSTYLQTKILNVPRLVREAGISQ